MKKLQLSNKKIFFHNEKWLGIITLIIASIVTIIFYYPFFKHGRIPAPLDIIPGMYFPWIDQRRDIFPNGGPVKNPLPSDVPSLTLPLRYISINILKNHEIPLWNSGILSGTPLLANFQSAVLNPLNLLYFTNFDFTKVWSIQVILQSFIAFLSFYIFISKHTKNYLARIHGSIAWAFNGFFSIWFQYNTLVYAAIFLPLCLWAIERINVNHNWGFLLAILLCFSVYSGNPPVTMIVYGVVFLYIPFLYFKNKKCLLLGIFFLVLSLFFSAPQLLTGIKNSNLSIRNTDNVAAENNIKFLPPIKLLTLFSPDFFGNPSKRNTWKTLPLYDNTTVYFGLFSIIIFVVSFHYSKFYKNKNLQYFSYFLFFLALGLMLPNIMSKSIGKLGIFGLSSMVFTRFSVLIALSLAITNSLFVSYLLSRDTAINIKKILFIFILAFIIIILPAIFCFVIYYLSKDIPLIDASYINSLKTGFRNSFIPVLFLLLYFLIFFLITKYKNAIKDLLIIILILISTLELYLFFTKYNSFSSTNDYYPESELTSYLTSNSFRFIRQDSQIIPSNMWLMYKSLQTPSGYDTTYSRYYGDFISLINDNRLTNSNSNRYVEVKNLNSPLINLLSIDHLVVIDKDKLLTSSTNQYELVKDYGLYGLFKNKSKLDYIRPVSKIYNSNSPEDTEILLKSKDYQSSAIIESTYFNKLSLEDSVIIDDLNKSTQSISFSSKPKTNNKPYFLIISENYDPGWQLKVDNVKQKLIRVNHTFLGVYLEPGNHNIQIYYLPKIFLISIYISVSAITASLFFVIHSLITKK